MILYFGTSKNDLSLIESFGLRNPRLTDSLEFARGQASLAAAKAQSTPVLLAVKVYEEELQYDGPAMASPPVELTRARDLEVEKIKELHPEWSSLEGAIEIPKLAWRHSLAAVKTCISRAHYGLNKIRVLGLLEDDNE